MSDFVWSYMVVPLAVIGLILVVLMFLSSYNTARAQVSAFLLPGIVALFGLALALFFGSTIFEFIFP
ncbi:hypothetical protein ACFFHT_00330 [Gallibacterium melopsittaci]|uniref:Uncharacterized protein n=1 Tax=Gallibacterium melopsittaci TaxID=516063 RepID=A0ABV6HT19_9PAST